MGRNKQTPEEKLRALEKVVERILSNVVRVKHADGECWRYLGGHTEDGYASINGKSASRLVLCVRGMPRRPVSLKDNPDWAGHLSPMICKYEDCVNPSHLTWEKPDYERRKQKRDRQLDPAEVKALFHKHAVKLLPASKLTPK